MRFPQFQRFNVKRVKKRYVLVLLFCLAALAAWSTTLWQTDVAQPPTTSTELTPVVVAAEPIQPIPLTLELDEHRVELGNQLFHDPRLSSDNSISCATCHILSQGGTDRLAHSNGMLGSNTGINAPTVFNSGFHSRLNWDGRWRTLEEQIDGPISTVKEMGGLSWPDIVNKLQASAEYKAAFRRIYQDEITPDHIKNALATFQRSLYTPNAKFDQYLRGDETAISQTAKQGYGLFKSYGCVTCHQGMLVGGNMFQSLGIFGDYFADRGNITKADLGRYNVTNQEQDRHVFKVPSLRNITLTSPYFHDGNAESLDEAIKLMAKYQLGVDMPQEDVDSIMQFLLTLEGDYEPHKS